MGIQSRCVAPEVHVVVSREERTPSAGVAMNSNTVQKQQYNNAVRQKQAKLMQG